jgi:NTE family protein
MDFKGLMMIKKSLIFILLFVFSANLILAEQPKLGLVLSGGGARGLAHIGVIKVLEKEGIRPDIITGTSMGSIIGGLYAMGYDAEALERIVREMDWELMFSDRIPRRNIAIEEKEDVEKFIATFPLKEGKVTLPMGLIAGHNISNKLSNLTLPVHHIKSFSELPIPFRCMTTDIETGEVVVQKDGYLADAMRASMAVPSVFTPVEINGRLLVDGGIVNNLPVSDAIEMGADVTIAVDVATPLFDRSQLSSALLIMGQTALFQSTASTKAEQKLADILITPEIGNLTAANFTNEAVDSLISIGEKAALQALPRIKALTDSLNIRQKKGIRFIPTTQIERLYIRDLELKGLVNVSKDVILNKLRITPPQWITPDELKTAIDRVYGSQFFEQVNYKLEPLGSGGVRLTLHVNENSANFLKVGVHYDDHLKSLLLLNLTFRNFFIDGSKFSLDLMLGGNPAFSSNLFYYTSWKYAPGIGMNIKLQNFKTFLYEGPKRTQELDLRSGSAAVMLHSNPVDNLFIHSGFQNEFAQVKTIIGTYPQTTFNIPSVFLHCHYDSYDNRFFPHDGSFINLYIRRIIGHVYSSNEKTQFDPYTTLTLRMEKAIPLTDNAAIIRSVNFGLADKKNIPDIHKFYMGGSGIQSLNFISLYGYQIMQLSGTQISSFSFSLRNQLSKNNYLFLRFNGGIASDELFKLIKFGKYNYGIGLTYGYDSPIGPVMLTTAKNFKRADIMTHISIGYSF